MPLPLYCEGQKNLSGRSTIQIRLRVGAYGVPGEPLPEEEELEVANAARGNAEGFRAFALGGGAEAVPLQEGGD